MVVVLVGKGNYGGENKNLGEGVEVEEGPVMGQVIQLIGGPFEKERRELKVFRSYRTTY